MTDPTPQRRAQQRYLQNLEAEGRERLECWPTTETARTLKRIAVQKGTHLGAALDEIVRQHRFVQQMHVIGLDVDGIIQDINLIAKGVNHDAYL